MLKLNDLNIFSFVSGKSYSFKEYVKQDDLILKGLTTKTKPNLRKYIIFVAIAPVIR